MKIGYNFNAFTDTYEAAVKAGFDYVETTFCDLAVQPESEVLALKAKTEKSGVPVLSANCLFWGTTQLLGENATPKDELNAYLEQGFTNAELLGIKKVVCGSGKGRSIPEGYDTEKGLDELAEIFRRTADIAARHGCLIVIEPLNPNESNVCTSVKDGADFVARIHHPAVKLLADSYHMRAIREGFDTLSSYKDILYHTHIAEAIEGETSLRRCPNRADENNIRSFVTALKEMGYDDTLTVEANRPEEKLLETITESLEVIREWLK